MTSRQRFIETLTFGRPDRIPFMPGYPMDFTLEVWQQQGLPPDQDFRQALSEALGIEPEVHPPQTGLGVSFSMLPAFEEKILEHRDGHYIVQDWMGAIVEISDRFDAAYHRSAKDFVTRKWHKFPVEKRADWEQMKQRYNPETPGRFPVDFEERCRTLRTRDHVASLHFNGPFWQLRDWCGFEGLCLLMADDPDFVQEMADFWTEFVAETMAPVLARVQLDSVGISEDMAFKEHSMISPEMVRRFVLPSYQRWVPEIKASGCPLIVMDCDGYVADLIPLWIETGISCCWPVETAAGNDIVEYRRRYGKQIAYRGGIDKRVLAAGGRTMETEVLRVVPPILELGGFIPQCDHAVPQDVSWPSFVEYSRLLATLTGWL
ncbi:MAG: uroporphyrinogen decarboxylase family protein [Armatimonadota bacterium]|jgi:uroporphyrinogen decarboxylase